MFDRALVEAILTQIRGALLTIQTRSEGITTSGMFTDSTAGMEKLDGICMLFMAVGESFKNLDKHTGGTVLCNYPEIDWRGVMGFRDIIAHHYFEVDADQVV